LGRERLAKQEFFFRVILIKRATLI